ncbi:hypothetical protein ALQ90_04356 [Pseudomonas savastanoi pv. savastanoi]|nr:hypothetical protein ALQ90_04356 [Pseudomonas savastanoi pv. savastanoi]
MLSIGIGCSHLAAPLPHHPAQHVGLAREPRCSGLKSKTAVLAISAIFGSD